MASVFSKIISGEIPCYKIAEDKDHLAFLDINPLVEGHVLVIPKQEVDYIFNIEDQKFTALWLFAKTVAKKIQPQLNCKRIGIAVIGLEVAHAHIHLVPINSVADIDFSQPKLKLSAEQLENMAKKLA